MTLAEQIEQVVARVAWGRASAAKRGRNPAYPYVPVVLYDREVGNGATVRSTHNPAKGVAFATREEAVAYAQRCIETHKEAMRLNLAHPYSGRAERRRHGLPEELPA